MPQSHFLIPFLLLLLGCCKEVQCAAPDFGFELWTMPIHYSFDPNPNPKTDNHYAFNEEQRKIVKETLKLIEENTCLSFVNDRNREKRIDFIFPNDGEDCHSIIATNETTRAIVKLHPSCIHTSSIQREIMRVLGFRPTQVRFDRDEYVKVSTSAAINNVYRKQDADVPGTTDYGVPYEHNSLLHSGADDKMEPLDPDYLTTMGGNNMLFNDWKVLNLHYKCIDKCAENTFVCENGGYQHPINCTQCICPRFHEGILCEKERALLTLVPGEPQPLQFSWSKSDDGETIITDESKFEKSPAHIIKAPEGTKINIHIESIGESGFGSDNEHQSCNNFGLEIVEGDLTRVGKRYCSWKNSGHTFVSSSNVVGLLIFSSPSFEFAANVTLTVEESPISPVESTTIFPSTTRNITPRRTTATKLTPVPSTEQPLSEATEPEEWKDSFTEPATDTTGTPYEPNAVDPKP